MSCLIEYCDLITELAKLEHEQWMVWSQELAKNEKFSDERLERWRKLWIPYEQLSNEQKRSDIMWARKVADVAFRFEKPLCPMLEQLRKMLTCSDCLYYKRCLKKLERKSGKTKVLGRFEGKLQSFREAEG